MSGFARVRVGILLTEETGMENERSKNRLYTNILRGVIYIFALVFSRWLMKWPVVGFGVVPPLFDWAGYGQMRPFVHNILTMIAWGAQFIALFFLERKLYKKDVEKSALDVAPAAKMQPLHGKFFGKSPLLPVRNVCILTAMVAASILILSAQIEFQVKPFYDIGEKVTGYEMLNKISDIVLNAVKCVWIVWILYITRKIAWEASLFSKTETSKQSVYCGLYFGLFMLFALYDVLTSGMTLGFKITYFCLFYPAFIGVDMLTEHQGKKAFLLILLIYIF